MKRATDRLEELPATSEIDAVVAVASVGGAAVHGDQLPGSQLTQVVRHEALRFSEQLRQLPDRAITSVLAACGAPVPGRTATDVTGLDRTPKARSIKLA
jgi:hypothetical protein